MLFIIVYQMAAAFQFEVIKLIGTAVDGLLTGGSLQAMNYTDCYQYNYTDPTAYTQANTIRDAIKAVNIVHILFEMIFGLHNYCVHYHTYCCCRCLLCR